MSLHANIMNDLRTAMKQQDAEKLSTLRMVKASIMNVGIDRPDSRDALLDDETVQQVLRKELKKRHDAAEAFRAGGRPELAEKEEREAALLVHYLPKELSDAELEHVVQEALRDHNGAAFGVKMGVAMKAAAGRADGSRVRAIVERLP